MPTMRSPAPEMAVVVAALLRAPLIGGQETPRTLVAVWAHADDEVAAAPVLARYAREGVQVYMIVATDGAQGGRYTSIPRGPELARARADEARCATHALGIHPPVRAMNPSRGEPPFLLPLPKYFSVRVPFSSVDFEASRRAMACHQTQVLGRHRATSVERGERRVERGTGFGSVPPDGRDQRSVREMKGAKRSTAVWSRQITLSGSHRHPGLRDANLELVHLAIERDGRKPNQVVTAQFLRDP